jgi:hypothetical protein
LNSNASKIAGNKWFLVMYHVSCRMRKIAFETTHVETLRKFVSGDGCAAYLDISAPVHVFITIHNEGVIRSKLFNELCLK